MTDYTHTLTNPGAETGDLTGWTNEINSFDVRDADPVAYDGTYYFVGGSYAECAIYQQVDLVTDSVPTATIDAGGIWFWVEWYQSSYGGLDQGEIQIRCLNSSLTEIATYNSGLTAIDDSQTWEQRIFAPLLPANTRYVDIILYGLRGGGTICNCNFDLITAKSTDTNTTEGYLSQHSIEVLSSADSANALLSQHSIEVLSSADSANALLSQHSIEVLRSTDHIKNNTFKDQTAEAAPTGITERWTTTYSSIKVKDEDGVVDSKTVQEDGAVYNYWVYYTLDDPASIADCEVLVKMKLAWNNAIKASDYQYAAIVLRGTEAYNSRDGYAAILAYGLTDATWKLQLGYWSSGSWTQLGTDYDLSALSIEWDRWFYIRFSVIGTAINVKAWGKPDDEPTDYQITQTDSTIVDAGYIGWAWRTNSSSPVYAKNKIDFIDVVTEGISSPATPVEEGDASVNIYKSNVEILSEDATANEVLIYKTTVDILSSVPSESGAKTTMSIVLF